MNGHAIKQYGELLLLHFLDPTMTCQQVTNVNGPRFQYYSAQLICACQCYQNCMWSSNSITNVFQAKMVMRPDCEMVHPCELWMWIYRVKCVALCGDVNGFAGFYQEISCNWLYWLQCCDVIPDENLGYCVIVRRAGLLWSQRDFEWRWSVPLFKCLTVLEFSFILFDLCLLITFFNFIMNYVPIVTFWIFTYHKIWILSIMFCSIWSYWIIYFLACLEVSWRVVS